MSPSEVQFVTREDFQRSIAAVMEELKVSREMAAEWQAKAEHLQEQERLAFLNRREEDMAKRAKEMTEHQRISIMATLAAGMLSTDRWTLGDVVQESIGLREAAAAIMEAAR